MGTALLLTIAYGLIIVPIVINGGLIFEIISIGIETSWRFGTAALLLFILPATLIGGLISVLAGVWMRRIALATRAQKQATLEPTAVDPTTSVSAVLSDNQRFVALTIGIGFVAALVAGGMGVSLWPDFFDFYYQVGWVIALALGLGLGGFVAWLDRRARQRKFLTSADQ